MKPECHNMPGNNDIMPHAQGLLSPQIWNQNRVQLPSVLGSGSPISNFSFPLYFGLLSTFPCMEKIC